MTALHADQRCDLAGCVDAGDVVGRVGHLEALWVASGQAVHVVDLFEHQARSAGSRRACRDVHRPELATDAALTQTSEIGVHGWVEIRGVAKVDRVEMILDPGSVLPRYIVVAVDQRYGGQHSPDDVLGCFVACLQLPGDGTGGDEKEEQRARSGNAG